VPVEVPEPFLDEVTQLGRVDEVAVVGQRHRATVSWPPSVGWAFSHVEPPVVE
jgi:hypothetical protein